MNHTLTKSEIVDSIQKANRFAFTTGKAKETVEILLEIVNPKMAALFCQGRLAQYSPHASL